MFGARPRKTLVYPKNMGLSKKQVLRERKKLPNPDIWDYHRRKSGAHVLKLNTKKAHKKLEAGTFRRPKADFDIPTWKF